MGVLLFKGLECGGVENGRLQSAEASIPHFTISPSPASAGEEDIGGEGTSLRFTACRWTIHVGYTSGG